jgi:hypothetical protein
VYVGPYLSGSLDYFPRNSEQQDDRQRRGPTPTSNSSDAFDPKDSPRSSTPRPSHTTARPTLKCKASNPSAPIHDPTSPSLRRIQAHASRTSAVSLTASPSTPTPHAVMSWVGPPASASNYGLPLPPPMDASRLSVASSFSDAYGGI